MFLLGYVVPKFSHVYEDIQGNLPLMSQWLLALGKFLGANGFLSQSWVSASQRSPRDSHSAPPREPGLARNSGGSRPLAAACGCYQLARFYRTLGMLLRGGTPIVAALDMASGLLVRHCSPVWARAEAIREGRAISEAMSGHGLTTPVALRMLRVGERSGRMDEMMDRIAGFSTRRSRAGRVVHAAVRALLMALIGVVIGVIVVLMYLPVFELAGTIQ